MSDDVRLRRRSRRENRGLQVAGRAAPAVERRQVAGVGRHAGRCYCPACGTKRALAQLAIDTREAIRERPDFRAAA